VRLRFVRRFLSWLLPPRRNRFVPWTIWEILVVFLLYLFWPALVRELLNQTRFFPWLYGPEIVQALAQPASAPERAIAESRVNLWSYVFSLPLYVATVLGVCGLGSGTRPYQLGVTTHRLGRNLLAGALGAVLLSPLHFLYQLLGLLFKLGEHPLSQLAQNHPLWVDKVVIVLEAMVAAPIIEELIFRGFLQPWVSRRRWGGEGAVLFAVGVAILRTQHALADALASQDWRAFAMALQPSMFAMLLAPGILLIRRMSPTSEAAGIYGTALLFAAAHSSVWPSPVPLFPLGLALGWLAYRTRSLAGPIVLHAVFNGIACVQMFA
jgi:membrane protease YdiL (CAAX protease family)